MNSSLEALVSNNSVVLTPCPLESGLVEVEGHLHLRQLLHQGTTLDPLLVLLARRIHVVQHYLDALHLRV